MAEVKPNTTVLQAGNVVRIDVAGRYLSMLGAKGGVSLWPEKEALSAGLVSDEPDRYWVWVFDTPQQASEFVAEHQKKVQAADAALATPVTQPEVK